MHVCMYVCIYIYIYIERERDRERERGRDVCSTPRSATGPQRAGPSTTWCHPTSSTTSRRAVDVYIYIYIYI